MSDRVQQGESDTFTETFRDSVGAGITDAVGKIVLYDVPSARYWSGAAFDSIPRFENNMDEISETNAPGRWEFPFTYPTSDTLIDFEIINTALNADINLFTGQVKVGGFVDDIVAPISGAASEANATANTVAINANVDANEAKLDIIDTNVTAIKSSTDNLPSDPASEAAATTNTAAIIAEIDSNDLALEDSEAAAVGRALYDPITSILTLFKKDQPAVTHKQFNCKDKNGNPAGNNTIFEKVPI